jgi:hypothetical protein
MIYVLRFSLKSYLLSTKSKFQMHLKSITWFEIELVFVWVLAFKSTLLLLLLFFFFTLALESGQTTPMGHGGGSAKWEWSGHSQNWPLATPTIFFFL